MLKAYFLLPMFLIKSVFAFATFSSHTIAEVLEEGHKLKMEDGFVWEVQPKREVCGYVVSDDPAKVISWEPGDEVALYFDDVGEKCRRLVFYLTNLRTQTSAEVTYGEQGDDWVATYLFAIDAEGYQILQSLTYHLSLSDGSCFEVTGYLNTRSVENWVVGDRVAIYRGPENTWILLNVDQGTKLDWLACRYNYHYSAAYAEK